MLGVIIERANITKLCEPIISFLNEPEREPLCPAYVRAYFIDLAGFVGWMKEGTAALRVNLKVSLVGGFAEKGFNSLGFNRKDRETILTAITAPTLTLHEVLVLVFKYLDAVIDRVVKHSQLI